MLVTSGRLDALVYPAGFSRQSSGLKSLAPVAFIPALSRCFVPTAHSQPVRGHWYSADKLIANLRSTRKHSSLYLGFYNSSNRQRCNLQCRVLAVSKAVEEQYVFRSATSTDDLRVASVLRAEAYYEVLRPTQCLHTQAGLHAQHSQKTLQDF